MKTALLALIALSGSAHAVTTCTDTVKQITIDVGGANPHFYVMLTKGTGFDIPASGEAFRVVLAMATTSKMTGSPFTIVYAANVNCAGAGYRTDLVRISTAEDMPPVR